MKPPYELTSNIVRKITTVSELIGEINAYHLDKPSPTLRKANQIRTIHSSLSIEGNTLSEKQITAIVENKMVIGPEKDILEVKNAIKIYQSLDQFRADSKQSFLKAHKILMKGLIDAPGTYRTTGVGIMKGSEVQHMAPPASRVPALMNDLFDYLKSDEISLIKSCVFHYEMEFIHPFMDGNGRMGRFWQTIILTNEYPIFQYIPFETIVSKTQETYYAALRESDKAGDSTPFILYMMGVLEKALAELLHKGRKQLDDIQRLKYFIDKGGTSFTRKDYMKVFKNISSATATRDLKKGLDLGLLKKEGEGNQSRYMVL